MLSPAEIAREYETVIRAAKIMKSNQMVERRWEGLEKKTRKYIKEENLIAEFKER